MQQQNNNKKSRKQFKIAASIQQQQQQKQQQLQQQQQQQRQHQCIEKAICKHNNLHISPQCLEDPTAPMVVKPPRQQHQHRPEYIQGVSIIEMLTFCDIVSETVFFFVRPCTLKIYKSVY